jgi:hypothetical protein
VRFPVFLLGTVGLALSFALCAALAQPQPSPDPTPAWAGPLLDQVRLTPAKAQLDPNRWTGGGQYRLDTFQRLWDDWRLIDPTARTAAKDVLAASASFEGLVATAARFIDVKPLPPAPPVPGTDKVPPDEALTRAVAELHAALDKPLSADQQRDLAGRAKAVPAPVASAAAVLLQAMPGALA